MRNIKTKLFYKDSTQGGGVGGINYAEHSDGSDLNYKFYNLRGDVVMTIDANNVRKSKYLYFGFGKNELENGSEIATDKHRANTKVEDEDNLLNEGKRFRHLELDIFLTPDPLEYVDGFNQYIYVNQNPWGRWDPTGLEWTTYTFGCGFNVNCAPTQKLGSSKSIENSAWAKFIASSDYKIDIHKKCFVAIEISFYHKNEKGEEIKGEITLLRPAKIKDGKVSSQEIKVYAQDSGNDVDIFNFETETATAKVKIALFEGDINGFNQSDVEFSDFQGSDGIYATYSGVPKEQTKDKWSSYAESQIEGIGSAYLTGSKTIEDLEKKLGTKALDKSPEYEVGYKNNQSSQSANLKKREIDECQMH